MSAKEERRFCVTIILKYACVYFRQQNFLLPETLGGEIVKIKENCVDKNVLTLKEFLQDMCVCFIRACTVHVSRAVGHNKAPTYFP